jgi:hypothetical protein
VYARIIVGWQHTTNMRSSLVVDVLEMGVGLRESTHGGLVAHTDRGSACTRLHYTDHLDHVPVVNAPSELREQISAPTDKALVDRCAGFRPGVIDSTTASAKHVLRALERLTTATAPSRREGFGIGQTQQPKC